MKRVNELVHWRGEGGLIPKLDSGVKVVVGVAWGKPPSGGGRGSPVGVTVSCALHPHLSTPRPPFFSLVPHFLARSSHKVRHLLCVTLCSNNAAALERIHWPSFWDEHFHLMLLLRGVNQDELCHIKVEKGPAQPPTAGTSKVGSSSEEEVWSSRSSLEAQLQRVGGENAGRGDGLCLPQLQGWQG